jgi:hypothetical protein
MDVYTTISFDKTRLERVKEIVNNTHLDLQEAIKKCLKQLSPKVRKRGFNTGSLTYQPVTLEYEPVHFSMTNAEYEIYMDLKKLSKCTLSLLIAIALDLFLEKIILEKNENIFDSYQESKYSMWKYVCENTIYLVFSWNEEVKGEENSYYKIE